MKIPPPKKKGILKRFCKTCGIEYPGSNKGRLCPKCKNNRNRASKLKYERANKVARAQATKEWTMKNRQRRVASQMLYLKRKRLKFHLERAAKERQRLNINI